MAGRRPGRRLRIGVVAPSSRMDPAVAPEVLEVAKGLYPDGSVEIVFHAQCFLTHNHFAGRDEARAAAFLEFANDEAFDAVWFGRGGYGACRIMEGVMPRLSPAALGKAYMGYSDSGTLLAGLYKAGASQVFHGPLPHDIRRAGGEAAVTRALKWLVERDPASLEPSVKPGEKTAAFNMTILSQMIGTPWQPDLKGHVLMLEEVGEYMYRIDRTLAHLTSLPALRALAGLRLGRCSDIPDNDPDFGMTAEEVAEEWCRRSGVPYLGRADIGHDADNKVAPFGKL